MKLSWFQWVRLIFKDIYVGCKRAYSMRTDNVIIGFPKTLRLECDATLSHAKMVIHCLLVMKAKEA
jgi:hypothetical protein